MPALLFCGLLFVVRTPWIYSHVFAVIFCYVIIMLYLQLWLGLLLWFRYGGYSFGLVREEIPENFGKNGPTQFRKLAVRHATLVSHSYLYISGILQYSIVQSTE